MRIDLNGLAHRLTVVEQTQFRIMDRVVMNEDRATREIGALTGEVRHIRSTAWRIITAVAGAAVLIIANVAIGKVSGP